MRKYVKVQTISAIVLGACMQIVISSAIQGKAETASAQHFKDGWTPLHVAAQEGHETVVEILLKNGADTASVTKEDGYTPLNLAAYNGHGAIVDVILNAGADKNAISKGGFTPLHMAAQECHEAIVGILLNAGARTEHRNGFGKTPLFHTLTVAVRTPEMTPYKKITSMHLLMDNASLKDALRLPNEEQNLLKEWRFDCSTFATTFEQRKILL
jgi:hypothetical protein